MNNHLTPFLSIIIPAHNEESRLPGTLEQIFRFLEKQSFLCEVLVIENGSADRTYEIAREFASRHPNLRVVQNEWRGKGLAIRRGMKEAMGEYLFLCDADLSMPVEEISSFLRPSSTTRILPLLRVKRRARCGITSPITAI